MRARACFSAGALLSGAILCLSGSSCSDSSIDSGQSEVKVSVQRLRDAVQAKNLDSIMEYYVPDESLFVYDAVPPRQYVGAKAFRKDWENFLALFPGPIQVEVVDWTVSTEGNLAYGYGPFRVSGIGKDGNPLDLIVRVTDVYRKIGGKWVCVHEHASWPVDLTTGKADLTSKP
jgi:ketosteroid isomerase-like protein